MAPAAPRLRRLTLSNYENFAQREFPNEYAHFANTNDFIYELKTFVDGNGNTKQADLISIGHSFKQIGTSNAWAHATISSMGYYSGLQSCPTAKLVPNKHQARIYFSDHPFSLMVNTENEWSSQSVRNGHNAIWPEVVNSVIYFVFLKTRKLKHVNCRHRANMLGSFKIACMNFRRNQGIEIFNQHVPLQQFLSADEPYAVIAEAQNRAAAMEARSSQHDGCPEEFPETSSIGDRKDGLKEQSCAASKLQCKLRRL